VSAELLLQEFDRVADSPDATGRLRRFVLALAVRGRLSEQLPADEPASQLVEALAAVRGGRRPRPGFPTLTRTEEPFTLPPSWEWIRLGDALEYDAGDKRDPSGLDPDSWLLELEDIESDSARILVHRSVKDRNPQSTKSAFKPGDVLYGKLRPYLNKVVVAREAGYSTTEIVAIRPFVLMSPAYICLALRRHLSGFAAS
jgi:type I restriction enzyme S subunit